MEREHLGSIDPRDTVDTASKNEHVLFIVSFTVSRTNYSKHTMKKNATLADDVALEFARPWKLSKAEIIIIQIPMPKDPHIIGLRRPYLSEKNVGKRAPMTNMVLMLQTSQFQIHSMQIITYTPPSS
jgi:hypothetical protein